MRDGKKRKKKRKGVEVGNRKKSLLGG